ncbi:MAG: AAA family ATPase [Candidatus Brockarchaeota archaeon]|nr:AAA family ATPase [Candidatus Brockarchaeota archaeon]
MSQELEQTAAQRAKEAVQLDRQGSRAAAIAKYQQAIQLLHKLLELTDDERIRSVYWEKIKLYQSRTEQLKSARQVEEPLQQGGARFEELVLTEKPKVAWQDVVGLESAKKAIRDSIIFPYRRPDLFPLGWPRGILLFGPPGCGKTLLAAAVANEIEASFYYVDAASIMSKWLGESEKNVASLFSTAREACKDGHPAIIFIDEVDSLTAVRQVEVGGEARARNQLLKEMDGLTEKGRTEHLYVLAATNKPWELDEPFVRRFQKRIYVPLPDRASRMEMFKQYLSRLKVDESVSLEALADATPNYSGHDIHDICMEAQMKVVRELFDSGQTGPGTRPRPITMGDLLEIVKNRRSSISMDTVVKIESWSRMHMAL